ncbi:pentatricopeptide repeat-containing protein At4g38150-like [Vigna unguiculata]|uniref:Nucleobase:cation symporter-1 n=1 Tax=Vigna unguiculata TaxID=3917 RepID=A0A4D6N097_VIGUN|nr:pentatricopeptide repeat-containing protein At4g38150-like [Vigna unguiculata]QCE07193.1 nucleobase:cation symporter-1 [Vigna unguiculata]
MGSLCGRGTLTAIRRTLIFTSNSSINPNSFFTTSLPHAFSSLLLPRTVHRHLCSTKTPVDTKLNFSLSDSDSESDDQNNNTHKENRVLPPPYDPFSKKPAIEDPKDPKDLQQIFHDMRSGDGLLNHAVKMFDALSKEGLTHEALELFAQIKDKGHMPDVVAHTAILEAYANAAQPKEAHKVYMRMLASGVSPNAYTYAVLVTALAADAKFVKDASKYLLEMMDKGMKPNAKTYTSVFEGLLKEERLDEATRLLEQMKAKGFVPDEKAVREVVSNKRGQVFRNLINLLFGR